MQLRGDVAGSKGVTMGPWGLNSKLTLEILNNNNEEEKKRSLP